METESIKGREHRLLEIDRIRTYSKVDSNYNINNILTDMSVTESKNNNKPKKGKICYLNYYDPESRNSKKIIVKKIKN